MLKMLREVVGGKNTQADDKKSPDAKVAETNKKNQTFAGMTSEQIKKELDKEDLGRGFLSTPKIGKEALESLNQAKDKSKKEAPMKVGSSSSLAEEIATLYSEGEHTTAIKILTDYLNENKGNVDKRFWYMLMDSYQFSNNKAAFEKVALAFSHKFETSPPSWFGQEKETKNSMMAGKNILILEPLFKVEQTEKFKEFIKAAREEKFCRINVSQCKFEQSEVAALHLLYKLFKDLRKYEVVSVLMGDNNLINFCKNYINPNTENKTLKADFLKNEELFWLIYLEILQWKGRVDEFENLALEYAMKFEVSPPGWENNGVMKIDLSNNETSEENQQNIEPILNSNNIQSLLDIIKEDFTTKQKCEIEFAQVERIDFSSAGSISFFIQELWSEPELVNKKVILKHPNEMILTLLEMVGATEFIDIVPKPR